MLVTPGHDYVVSLTPKFMTPLGGADKQNSEATAAQRWLAKHSRRFAPWSVTIITDDLVSPQPFCLVLHQHDCHYILVCKPESHALVYVHFLARPPHPQVHPVGTRAIALTVLPKCESSRNPPDIHCACPLTGDIVLWRVSRYRQAASCQTAHTALVLSTPSAIPGSTSPHSTLANRTNSIRRYSSIFLLADMQCNYLAKLRTAAFKTHRHKMAACVI